MKNLYRALTALMLIVSVQATAQENIFSESFSKGIPVQIINSNKKHALRYNGSNEPVASGVAAFSASEAWLLVGNADGFKLYNLAGGKRTAAALDGSNKGAAATMTKSKNATLLKLTAADDGTYAISPADNPELSFNMYGGAGRDIKLYSSKDPGSRWSFRVIDTSKPLTIGYNVDTDGSLATNTRIGTLALKIEDTEGAIEIDKTLDGKRATYYLPRNAEFSIATGLVCHGWSVSINGADSTPKQTLPKKGLKVNVSAKADKANRYQYLFYSPDEKGIPYRIPAIATTANGYVFAINDYRPCGNDIGFGEVDLVMRHSTAAGSDWDGHSWSAPVKIADGQGKEAPETWLTGFGDPAVVADRERNEILVMSVCGNRLCWHGNYGAGTPENPENPNRIARLRIKYNEQSKQWEAGTPEEVTYNIYPLFKDKEGKAHVGSMFIGAGRIAQSSKIKTGDYYRIYCAVWAVETGSYRHHNYALYSDDFGESWHLLGELGNNYSDSPAPYGNEPKCEELPDGSVLLSSRKGYGRYFNVFHYTNIERAEGYWDGAVATDQAGDLKFGSNDTNGEPLRIGNVLFQSVPTGNSRSNVAVYYKVLSNDPATYTPTSLSNGWTKIPVSDRGSAYSSMCILPDGESIGLYYEEEPGGYSMVYVPLILKELLPEEVYRKLKE